MNVDLKDEQRITADIQWLFGKLSNRDAKYNRNYHRFLSNGLRRETVRELYNQPSSFFNGQIDTDTGQLPAINVGRSISLTLRSKLIQTKGRIFFSPVNGLWSTIKMCRNAQIYFDALIERDELNNKIKQCVLDAMVFDYGPLWIDDETKSTYRLKPWEFYVDPAELNYGKVSRCMIMFENYPLISLKDKLPKDGQSFQQLESNETVKVKVYHYWDLTNKKRYLIVNSEFISVTSIEYNRMPVALFYYEDPIKGLYSNSVMDNTYQNQRQIDDILYRIHDAMTLSPANTIYIPQSAGGANDSVGKMLSNKVGNIVEYNAALGAVTVSTPPAIDQQYFTALQFFVQSTFEQEGVSQLSAQSKKPAGVDSGVALDTLQDVESERFQAQVDNLIQFYKDIYSIMIDVFPEGDDILPKRINRSNIKWSEIKKQRESFNMSSSLTSMLSKDPSKRIEEIEHLQTAGFINPNMAASLLQLPDLEGAYSAATASYDNCLKIIERAIEDDKYDFFPVVKLQQLLEESVNILLQLDSVDEKPEVLARVSKLIQIVMDKMNTTAGIQAQGAPQAPVMNLDGREMTAIATIAADVTSGLISPEQALAALMIGFPNANPDLLAQIAKVQPKQPEPQLPGQPIPVNQVAPPVVPGRPVLPDQTVSPDAAPIAAPPVSTPIQEPPLQNEVPIPNSTI